MRCPFERFLYSCPARLDLKPCCFPLHRLPDADVPKIRKHLIKAIKIRENDLAELAMQHLSARKFAELGILDHAPPDSKAYATYMALQGEGILVSKRLYPGSLPLLLSFFLHCSFSGFDLARATFDSRLCDINASLSWITPLVSFYSQPFMDGRKEECLEWFLNAGAIATFNSPFMLPNLLFYLAIVHDSDSLYS